MKLTWQFFAALFVLNVISGVAVWWIVTRRGFVQVSQ
jgi:hypothetical protein